MSDVIVKYNQTHADIAIQEYGDAERMFEMVLARGVSITDDLIPGDTITIPDLIVPAREKQVVKILQKIENPPACGDGDAGTILEGISIWGINADFIVTPQ